MVNLHSRRLSRLGLFCCLFLAMQGFDAQAYDLDTHKWIVHDAINYMLTESKTATRELDAKASITDLQLLKNVLAPTATSEAEAVTTILSKTQRILAQAAKDTDNFRDVWIKPCAFCPIDTAVGSISFTVLSHFLNVKGERAIWQYSGYYYPWVEQNQDCSQESGLEDEVANYFVGIMAKTFDRKKSLSFDKYGEPRLVSAERYKEHFDQDIKYIQFWPITNLALHYYGIFRSSPKDADDKSPVHLEQLGPVLHAAADTTVPFHAVGLSGCGHGEYEALVEKLYMEHLLFDRKMVTKYLQDKSISNTKQPIDKMLERNALYAYRYCDCTGTSCNCHIDRIQEGINPKSSKELVNLAIASTVVIVRKAFNDWLEQSSKGQIESHQIKLQRETEVSSPRYTNWNLAPVEEPAVYTDKGERSPEASFAVSNSLNEMKMAVSNYENGKTSKKEFLTQLNNVATTSGSEGPKGGLIVWNPAYRKYVGLPPIGQDPKRFRLPSLDEIRNENAWQSYLKERQKFNRSERLFHSTKTLLALSQELTKDHSEMEISEINKSILQVKESIKVLAEE